MKFMKSEVVKALEYIKEHSGEQITIVDIAEAAGVPHSNARYMLDLLVKQGRIEKVPLKATHKYYVRYTYNFIK